MADGIRMHKVWVNSKQDAFELVWPDDSKMIGRFVYSGHKN